MNFTTKTQTDVTDHLKLNAGCADYSLLKYYITYPDNQPVIDVNKLPKGLLSIIFKNLLYIEQLKATREISNQINVGDYLLRDNGKLSRITHIHEISVQDGGNNGSFFMYPSGNASYSGGLDAGIPKKNIRLSNQMKSARFWFFSNQHARAHNGIYFDMDVKIWKEVLT